MPSAASIRAFGPVLLLLTLLSVAPSAQAQNATPGATVDRCESLAGGRWADEPDANTWITKAIHRPATAARPAVCEIEGYVSPQIYFGMYLPTENWNGKYIFRGCGGSCGTVWTDGACSAHARDGYACIMTDMGHHSTQIDNNWTVGNVEGQIDFGFRSTHVSNLIGKLIVDAYYGKSPRLSYFYGCSTGGRQAMVEAQRFPDDFDGIVAVAPASMGPFGERLKKQGNPNVGADGRAVLPNAKVPAIYKAVIAQCDMKDGVKDGLVDPRDCHFDPASLQCKAGEDTPRCLTPPQVAMVKTFYARGAQPGSELNWINNWTAEPGPAREFAQRRGDMTLVDTFDNPTNPDLRAFKAHGGKMIFTHGTTDLVVPTGPSIDYYDMVTRTMGGAANTLDFFRFFLVTGMDHCSGGTGAWGIDYVTALDRWVDGGKAPEKLVGIAPKPEAQLDYFGVNSRFVPKDQILFSRAYFPHPLRAYYDGKGDPTDAASFVAATEPSPALREAWRRREAALPPATIPDADALTVRIQDIVKGTELAFQSVHLPTKNISDRIGKALRQMLYTSGASDASIAEALRRVERAPQTPAGAEALKLLAPEYGLAPIVRRTD